MRDGLSVEHLSIRLERGDLTLVDDLSFAIAPGKMTALVGESGSGKTLAARSILGLLAPGLLPSAESRIIFDGEDLSKVSARKMRAIRGAKIGMIFQEPMVSLNPSMKIGQQLAEAMRLHTGLSAKEIRAETLKMLERVQIGDPERCLSAWPHEFSGGMRQRIMIASVMLLKPRLLIADEPTTALDTLVSRDVLDLMAELTRDSGTSVLMISHDLGMVARYVDDIVVMEKGRAVESGPAQSVLRTPQHGYTQKLVAALPSRGPARPVATTKPLVETRGLSIGYPEKTGPLRPKRFRRVVHDVDLTIQAGETLALVGASGSGKTTLGRTLIGLEKAETGTIRFRGSDISDQGQHRIVLCGATCR
ncbi:ATP-binding cassette domain-containing protein [Rhodobacteraceae bacterium D3-12]|nr:ATP-binding cassette domain-containing protein [Rhodobacteraceae bacterium D3-12]